jgi:ketosteroid isomerase-like protein
MEDVMTLAEIAKELVAGCREGREKANLAALLGKHAWWAQNFETHGLTVEGPFTHGEDRFGVVFGMDVTNKATGERNTDNEVAVYHVKDGKIVREEFFYKA